MLPKGFQWRRNASAWGEEQWLLAHGKPVGIVSVLADICYASHPAANDLPGWTTQRAQSPEEAVVAIERWALAHARRR